MKKIFVCVLITSFLNFNSFAQKNNFGEPNAEPDKIAESITGFLMYRQVNTILSEDFIAIDTASNIISKENFITQLTSGDYLPIRLSSKNAELYYKLYKLNSSANDYVRVEIKRWALDEWVHYKQEGKDFPDFNFTDLNGNVYNKETTKNKILVLKCWFINCPQCVAEMPALNDLVKQYKNRTDIIFVSLAIDSKNELLNFLKEKKFIYPIVADQKKYMIEDLKVDGYPTHFIINKQGIIIKEVHTANEMISALNKEVSK